MTEPDWDAIELDYRAGILSDSMIASKYDIPISGLRAAARSRGWTKTIIPPDQQAEVETYAIQRHPRFPCDSLFDADEVKKAKLMTMGQVLGEHRQDIMRLRTVSKHMLVTVEHLIETGDATPMLPFLSKNDSASDLVEKVSRIMTRGIALERQAYGLENMSVDNTHGDDNPLAKDIKDLSEKLRIITEQKAQRADGIQNTPETSAQTTA